MPLLITATHGGDFAPRLLKPESPACRCCGTTSLIGQGSYARFRAPTSSERTRFAGPARRGFRVFWSLIGGENPKPKQGFRTCCCWLHGVLNGIANLAMRHVTMFGCCAAPCLKLQLPMPRRGQSGSGISRCKRSGPRTSWCSPQNPPRHPRRPPQRSRARPRSESDSCATP